MLIDDIKRVIAFARGIQVKLRNTELWDNQEEILRFLKIIKDIDLDEQYTMKRKNLPKDLMRKVKLVYRLANRAINEIEDHNYVPENVIAILEEIIALEEEISSDVSVLLPTLRIKEIIRFSPAETLSRGLFYRGVSVSDCDKLNAGESIYAPNPRGEITITEHIFDSSKSSDSQFISLTTDVNVAKHFGRLMVLKKDMLIGHLYNPADIERDLKRHGKKVKWTKALRLQRKNSEFLLGPKGSQVATIMPEAVINLKGRRRSQA